MADEPTRPAGEVDTLLHDPQPVHAAPPAVPAAVPVPAVRPRQPGRRRPGCSAGSAPPTGSTATSPGGSARSASSARSSTRPSTACCSSSPSSRSSSTAPAPLWFCVAVLVRELLVGGTIAIATLVLRHGSASTSRWWGKLATFLLMFAIPGFMLGCERLPRPRRSSRSPRGSSASPAWCCRWITAVAYVPKIRAGIAAGRASRRSVGRDGGAAPPISIRLRAHERPRAAPVLERPRVGQPRRGRRPDRHHRLRPGRPRRRRVRPGPDGRRRRSAPATRSARSRARSRSPTSTPRCRAPSSRSTRRSPTPRSRSTRIPYGDGWICTIRMSDPAQFDALLDAAAYRALIEG